MLFVWLQELWRAGGVRFQKTTTTTTTTRTSMRRIHCESVSCVLPARSLDAKSCQRERQFVSEALPSERSFDSNFRLALLTVGVWGDRNRSALAPRVLRGIQGSAFFPHRRLCGTPASTRSSTYEYPLEQTSRLETSVPSHTEAAA